MSRQPRYQRDPAAPAIQLTPRDYAILIAVSRYRLLSQAQLRRLFFTHNHPSIAQQRLRALFDHGYLQRHNPPSLGGWFTSPVLYRLDRRGAATLWAEGHTDVHWMRTRPTAGFTHLEHLLDINTFRVEVELTCQAHPALTLVKWVDDTELGKHPPYVAVSGQSKKVPVIPDGYFVIRLPSGQQLHFFLELDRATMPLKRFRQKIRAYLALTQTGLAQTHFQTEKYRVLTVTLGATREDHLKVTTEDLGGENRFWFGILPELTAPQLFTTPLWRVAQRPTPAPLLTL